MMKSLKIVCNLCQFQVFHRDQMKRHLLDAHDKEDIQEHSHSWWCVCPDTRYVNLQGFYLAQMLRASPLHQYKL